MHIGENLLGEIKKKNIYIARQCYNGPARPLKNIYIVRQCYNGPAQAVKNEQFSAKKLRSC